MKNKTKGWLLQMPLIVIGVIFGIVIVGLTAFGISECWGEGCESARNCALAITVTSFTILFAFILMFISGRVMIKEEKKSGK